MRRCDRDGACAESAVSGVTIGGAGAAARPHGVASAEVGVASAEVGIFNRASLRPDDAMNIGKRQQAAALAAAESVLHPQLLGKSQGARKLLARRVEKITAAASTAEGGGGAVPSGGRGGSTRAARRQARNQGRGQYEKRVREQLGTVSADGSSWLSSWVRSRWVLPLAAGAVATTIAILVARRAMARR